MLVRSRLLASRPARQVPAKFAAFLAAGEMAFAYFLGHFPIAFWPVVSKGVPAVLFCFAFLFIAAHGAGQWSLDNLWRKRTNATLHN